MGGLGPTTFVERVAVAARETVYSAAIAWLLDQDSPLTLPQRLSLVRALSDADVEGGQAVSAITEWQDVDLLVTVERVGRPSLFVAVENKIKSTEGAAQLETYDQRLAQLPGEVAKVFLTLTGEAPVGGTGWQPRTYEVLVRALRELRSPDLRVEELCTAFDRLVATMAAVLTDQRLAEAAFGDVEAGRPSGLILYMQEMRLQKVVQRAWMTALARMLPVKQPWRTRLSETRGQALIDLEAELVDRPGFRVGMQVQWRTLKVFGAPHPYPERASPSQHQGVELILGAIRESLQLGARARPSRQLNRGFRSFSLEALPPGRNLEAWAAALAPYVEKLDRAFPAVKAVESLQGTVENEDE